MIQTRVAITIPEDLRFEALHLARQSDGSVSFDWAAIERLCAASGLDARMFRAAPESNIAGLIVAWYAEHRAHGGAPDPTAEDLIFEARIEDARGGGLSHEPGRG